MAQKEFHYFLTSSSTARCSLVILWQSKQIINLVLNLRLVAIHWNSLMCKELQVYAREGGSYLDEKERKQNFFFKSRNPLASTVTGEGHRRLLNYKIAEFFPQLRKTISLHIIKSRTPWRSLQTGEPFMNGNTEDLEQTTGYTEEQ